MLTASLSLKYFFRAEAMRSLALKALYTSTGNSYRHPHFHSYQVQFFFPPIFGCFFPVSPLHSPNHFSEPESPLTSLPAVLIGSERAEDCFTGFVSSCHVWDSPLSESDVEWLFSGALAFIRLLCISLMLAPATPRTVFACAESSTTGAAGVGRILSTPFLSKNSNVVPCGGKLFAAIYPANTTQSPFSPSLSSSLNSLPPVQCQNVLCCDSAVFSMHVHTLGSTACFIHILAGDQALLYDCVSHSIE
jgi:hypothetical protein